jgi:hypothetical protein
LKRFRIRLTDGGGHDRFALLLADDGREIETGPCAKTLADVAWDLGAEQVHHDYDLGADDCDTHMLRRVRN